MKTIIQILDEINGLSGAAKGKKLAEYSDVALLKEVWHMAYGNHTFFTTVAYPNVGQEDKPNKVKDVLELLNKLENREATGQSAKNLIHETLSELNTESIELYNRIIAKNLGCGIGLKAGNKVWGKDFIEEFPVMLISPHCNKKAGKILQSKGGGVLQLKSDGVRGVMRASFGDTETIINYYTRQGEEILQLADRFQEELDKLIEEYSTQGGWAMLDGEFVVIGEDGVHDPKATSGILNKCLKGTATQEEIDSLTYVVWDFIVDEDLEEYSATPYTTRILDLQVALEGNERIICVDSWNVSSIEEVHAKYNEIVEAGNEGVVLKSTSNVWKPTRVTDCIKYKEKHQAEFKVTGIYLGKPNGEFRNVIGGYSIESACGKVVCNTGSGLSFKERGILMTSEAVVKKGRTTYVEKPVKVDGVYQADPDFDMQSVIGTIVTMEYNQRTKDKNGRDTYSLRFPIVKAHRFDKSEPDTMLTMVSQESSSYGLRT